MQKRLQNLIENSILDEDKARLYSRTHSLKGFGGEVYVKREDELSFGVSGSKLRKLLGIKKQILDKGVRKLIIIGGLNSNHLLSSLQMALELGLDFEIVCLEEHQTSYRGNRFLTELLLGNERKINFINRDEWADIYSITKEKYKLDASVYVIAEGAYQKDALYSAMTVFEEINTWNKAFKDTKDLHVWIDSGTGLLSQAVELANGIFEADFIIHPVLIAGNENDYLSGLQCWLKTIKEDGLEVNIEPSKLHKPLSAKSFGATNKTVFTEIIKQARINGMLIDPVYAAKSLYLMNEEIKAYSGRHLWLHGGGAFSLFGYQEKILSYLL